MFVSLYFAARNVCLEKIIYVHRMPLLLLRCSTYNCFDCWNNSALYPRQAALQHMWNVRCPVRNHLLLLQPHLRLHLLTVERKEWPGRSLYFAPSSATRFFRQMLLPSLPNMTIHIVVLWIKLDSLLVNHKWQYPRKVSLSLVHSSCMTRTPRLRKKDECYQRLPRHNWLRPGSTKPWKFTTYFWHFKDKAVLVLQTLMSRSAITRSFTSNCCLTHLLLSMFQRQSRQSLLSCTGHRRSL